jgi:uncharacterized Zn-finger protein
MQTRTGKLAILDNRYSCDQCANAVRRLRSLTRHMQLAPQNLAILDNQYSCNQCAKTFRRLHFLMKHMQTRTGKNSQFWITGIVVISVQMQLDVYTSS